MVVSWLLLIYLYSCCSTCPMVDAQICNPCGHSTCSHWAKAMEENRAHNCHMCGHPHECCRNLIAAKMMEGITVKCWVVRGMCPSRISGSILSTNARKLSSTVACAQWSLNREMCCNKSQSTQKRSYCVPVGNNCSAKRNQNIWKHIAIMSTCPGP